MLMPDISEWNPTADIFGIRKQTPAIILRVGYGHDHKDKFIGSWRPSAVSAGFQWTGLYHYLRADQDAAWQAQVYCSWVGSLNRGEIPILDLEEGGGDQSGRANAWLNFVDSYFGLDRQPLNTRSWLYSYGYFITHQGLGPIFASARRTWLAAYQASEPAGPPHSLWQSTNGVTGANKTNWAGAGYCDTSYTAMSIDQLAATGWQGTQPHPPPPPPPSDDWLGAIMSTLPNLQQGATGNDVRTAQGLLAARGHAVEPGTPDLGIDGIFGPATDTVVRSVQQGWGLTVDGVIGQQTWAKLLNR